MKQNTDSNYNFLLTGAATNVGRVRKANEDSMAIFETASMKVFVVCDGMGGHVGGQVASQTAITSIRDFLINNIILDPREAINNSIIAANETIQNRTRQQPELAGMGSTCVMLVVTSDGKVYYGHIGDSRIYIVANHKITQLTEDHSVVYEMFKEGIIKTREEMERHPRKNEITNALGLQGMQPPTICNAPIEPDSGNCFLLCSDGLTGMVADEQIRRIISKHEIPIQQRVEKLIQIANENGGEDNITVELVEFAIGMQQIGNNKIRKTKSWKKTLLFVLPALLVLGGLIWFGLSKFSPDKPIDKSVVTDSTKQENPVKIEHIIFPTDENNAPPAIPEIKPNETKPNAGDKIVLETYPDTLFIVCDAKKYETVELRKILKNESWKKSDNVKTSFNKIKANVVNEIGTLNLTWISGKLPGNGITVYPESKSGKIYAITIYLKEKKKEKVVNENPDNNKGPETPSATENENSVIKDKIDV